jgi:hypothetical protein
VSIEEVEKKGGFESRVEEFSASLGMGREFWGTSIRRIVNVNVNGNVDVKWLCACSSEDLATSHSATQPRTEPLRA